jgi:hypothetical protein
VLVAKAEPALQFKLAQVDKQINELELSIVSAEISEEERSRLQKKREEFRQAREKIKWEAYTKYLQTKDKTLAPVIAKLVETRFDFGQLSVADQQVVLNVLVKHKLNDLISRQAPELLGIDAADLKKFTDDLFDLNKKDLFIPTRE